MFNRQHIPKIIWHWSVTSRDLVRKIFIKTRVTDVLYEFSAQVKYPSSGLSRFFRHTTAKWPSGVVDNTERPTSLIIDDGYNTVIDWTTIATVVVVNHDIELSWGNFQMTLIVAQPLCDSWASCVITDQTVYVHNVVDVSLSAGAYCEKSHSRYQHFREKLHVMLILYYCNM